MAILQTKGANNNPETIQISSGFFGWLPNLPTSRSLLEPLASPSSVGNFTFRPIAVEPKKYELFYKSVKSLEVSFQINLSDGVDVGEQGTRFDFNGSASNSLELAVLSENDLINKTRAAREFKSVDFLTPILFIGNGLVGQFDARFRRWNSEGELITDTTNQLDFLITIQVFDIFRAALFDSNDHYPFLTFSTDFFSSVATTTPNVTKEVPFADWGNVTAAFSILDETGTNSLSIEIDETF